MNGGWEDWREEGRKRKTRFRDLSPIYRLMWKKRREEGPWGMGEKTTRRGWMSYLTEG